MADKPGLATDQANAFSDTLYGKHSPSVSLHYRVNLSQDTGEDWANAKLALSTYATDSQCRDTETR